MSKIYLKQDVYDAALERIGRLFDAFDEVIVNVSGGKDSTVVLNLALRVAEQKGRLPLSVLFLDQEAEWENVIDHVRTIMADPRVRPYWFQGPFKLFNATSASEPWLYCWQEGAAWIREKEPNSLHENRLGTDRFKALFDAFPKVYFPNRSTAQISGVRCEESPGRLKGLTGGATFQDITWGRVITKKAPGHYTFYPLYDWGYRDIWKAIHDHGWHYCRLYDYEYQYGVPVLDMRVSNVHHETAIHSLKFLQEIEPETWNRITARVSGVNAVNQAREAYEVPKKLPCMFRDWQEYRAYLLEHLIADPVIRETFRHKFAQMDAQFLPAAHEALAKCGIASLLVNDYEGTKLANFASGHDRYRKGFGTGRDRYSYHAQ